MHEGDHNILDHLEEHEHSHSEKASLNLWKTLGVVGLAILLILVLYFLEN